MLKLKLKAPKPDATPARPPPKIKIKTKLKPGVPRIRVKRQREPGLGYDSEDPDREDDPHIEEQFILRMRPGEDCDYLRKAIEEKLIGNGAHFWIKFKDPKNAVVSIRGHLYSAKLVDLPTIIESHKTLDKKSLYKTADICQMLIVGERIEDENTVLAFPSKPQDYVFPHGLTAPLKWVRKRRFRKRVSNRTIEATEREVERLLQSDQEAMKVEYDIMDAAQAARESSVALSDYEAASPYAHNMLNGSGYGHEDEDVDIDGDDYDPDALADELEREFMEEGSTPAQTPGGTAVPARTPGTAAQSDDSGSESDSGDENDNDAGMDEEERERAQHQKLLREEIAELEATIENKRRDAANAPNPIMRARFMDVVTKLQAELELKLANL
ncbi:hypothetical protein G7K_5833-t1 [Saitoella complicata NRRL Y-17804]|uniref:TAFII55 protein conserved region domain-containing protein n=2 Tax=Saitoella complicata (strain BCRC 22490 / CBS 7301 / JCM 7358 / NBRC 10748 / NRRL Y-17804) TaxID=698492 RepID=A0A0E9NQP0_SAICN|nr:hypothetical protein G7K_5833-t1 [Saitoella complicata NRRL Y-17804]